MPNKTYTCLGTTTKNKQCKLKTTSETKFCPFHKDQFKDNEKEKKFKFEKPEDCIICCEEFAVDDMPLSPCGHWIHKMCVFQTGKQQCPICRGFVEFTMDEKKIFEKYEKKKKEDEAEDLRRENEEMLEDYLINSNEILSTFMSHLLNSVIDSDMNIDTLYVPSLSTSISTLPSFSTSISTLPSLSTYISTLSSLTGGRLIEIVNGTTNGHSIFQLYI